MRFGVHVSTAKGPEGVLANAQERGCEAVQIFSSNPRGWALSRPDDAALKGLLDRAGIGPTVLHTPYLLNLASADDDVYARTASSLVHAAERARILDGYVVVHAGRDSTADRDRALTRAAAAVLTARKLVPGSRILIEPTAGGKGSVASRVEELAELLGIIDDPEVGACLDTCHAHACGHDLSTPRKAKAWVKLVAELIGWERVPVLHCNDSRDPVGACRDRHQHLGEGTIGDEGFRAILSDRRLGDIAVICETPGEAADDLRNVQRAREYAARTR